MRILPEEETCRMKLFAASRIRLLENPRVASMEAKDKRGRNFGGQGKPSPVHMIQVPMRGTRRKRIGMNLRQNNQIMITSKERGKPRPGEIKENRRAKRQVNKQKQIRRAMIVHREARVQTTEGKDKLLKAA